ncbi:hypothetical protein GDO81_021022 [Engystomops pustulosus]|uniref:Uncharacterized protein n=1 Tax=Engystomops pustulosus TaxID=76066 RepID=A0AAV6YW38_ENGPU|nr:hypothetical protein GDO81_021022 [Engystomops pustulosus]
MRFSFSSANHWTQYSEGQSRSRGARGVNLVYSLIPTPVHDPYSLYYTSHRVLSRSHAVRPMVQCPPPPPSVYYIITNWNLQHRPILQTL